MSETQSHRKRTNHKLIQMWLPKRGWLRANQEMLDKDYYGGTHMIRIQLGVGGGGGGGGGGRGPGINHEL